MSKNITDLIHFKFQITRISSILWESVILYLVLKEISKEIASKGISSLKKWKTVIPTLETISIDSILQPKIIQSAIAKNSLLVFKYIYRNIFTGERFRMRYLSVWRYLNPTRYFLRVRNRIISTKMQLQINSQLLKRSYEP